MRICRHFRQAGIAESTLCHPYTTNISLLPEFTQNCSEDAACSQRVARSAVSFPDRYWLPGLAVDLVSYHILAGWTWYLSRNKTELSNRSSRSSRPWQDSKASNRAAAAIFSRSAPMYEAEPRSSATSSFSLRVPGTLPAVEKNMVKLWQNHRESLLKPRLKSSSKIKIHRHDEEVIVQDWRQRRKRPVDLYMDENCNQNHQKIPSTLLKLDSKLLCEEFPKGLKLPIPMRIVPTEGGFHFHGVPQMVFFMENPIKNGWLWGTPILGTPGGTQLHGPGAPWPRFVIHRFNAMHLGRGGHAGHGKAMVVPLPGGTNRH